MKYVLTLVMMLVLGLPGSAGEREDALLNGLLGLGARALEVQVGHPAETPAAPALPDAPSSLPTAGGMGFAGSLKQSLNGLVLEYKEEFKEEGRAYARELGDMVVMRVREDPEISSTIASVRTLCWVVIAYLTLVTLIMLGCLVYLRRANAELLAEVRRLARQASVN